MATETRTRARALGLVQDENIAAPQDTQVNRAAEIHGQLAHGRIADTKQHVIRRMRVAEFEEAQGETVSPRGRITVEVTAPLKDCQGAEEFSWLSFEIVRDLGLGAGRIGGGQVFDYIDTLFERGRAIGWRRCPGA